ncbi:transcriptional regulator [Brevibacillus choshinensis]|uniref:LexA family protein n=1 Tax=Brevibacillus choshinensis TaxID=54911 RepID=UPI002E221912|nr:transcriptional regulator [Brevibacillus choshinensis]
MRRITTKQRNVLDAIMEFTKNNKYPPTMRELSDMVGLKSVSTLYTHLEKLKVHGLITWEPSSPRTITVVEGEDIAV